MKKEYKEKIKKELENFITNIQSLINNKVPTNEVNRVMGEYVMSLPEGLVVPSNPFSQEYLDFQQELYSTVSNVTKYDPYLNELTPEGTDKLFPFPYSTRSPGVIFDTLDLWGRIILYINSSEPLSILEVGAGTGSLTLQLALCGFRVTAIDIDPENCSLIRERAKGNGLSNYVTAVDSDMIEFSEENQNKKYDVILFCSSFHHCWNHVYYVSLLKNMLAPSGRIIFIREPVANKLNHFPYPWGVRLDGLSLWSIYNFGWLELGFETDYFISLLSNNGLSTKEYPAPGAPTNTFIASLL